MFKRQKICWKYGMFGFTLAEVLITLGIIGVVAGMTIPILMNNTQRREYVTALKKANSIIAQAIIMIKQDNGGTLVGIGNSSNVFLQYLHYSKKCNAGEPGCWANPTYNLNGTLTSNVSSGNLYVFSPQQTAVLSDGMLLNFCSFIASCDNAGYSLNGVNMSCGRLQVDVNGFKGPNTYGRDIFEFYVTDRGPIPSGANGILTTGICDPTVTTDINGLACTAKVLNDGVENY